MELVANETNNLEDLLAKIAPKYKDELDRYHAIADAPVDKPMLGIVVTQKMHQICEDKRDDIIEERHVAMVKARKV